jgi:hypothetical protein
MVRYRRNLIADEMRRGKPRVPLPLNPGYALCSLWL